MRSGSTPAGAYPPDPTPDDSSRPGESASSQASLDASPDAAQFVRTRFYLNITPPRLTWVILGINLLVFLGMIGYGYWEYDTWDGTQDLRVLVDFGAKVNILIAEGEVWRLFTAMFLHIGVIHLLFNLYALNALGPLVEGYFGHVRFFAIYMLGGLFGSLASYAFSDAISAGASGAIFGLAGAATVYFLRYRENFGARGRALLQNMLLVIGINIIFGLSVPGIDNWGHMGGLVGGALVAYGLLPVYIRPTAPLFAPTVQLGEADRTTFYTLWVAGCIILLVLGMQWATQNILG
jgi:rhomboid protease GluP